MVSYQLNTKIEPKALNPGRICQNNMPAGFCLYQTCAGSRQGLLNYMQPCRFFRMFRRASGNMNISPSPTAFTSTNVTSPILPPVSFTAILYSCRCFPRLSFSQSSLSQPTLHQTKIIAYLYHINHSTWKSSCSPCLHYSLSSGGRKTTIASSHFRSNTLPTARTISAAFLLTLLMCQQPTPLSSPTKPTSQCVQPVVQVHG